LKKEGADRHLSSTFCVSVDILSFSVTIFRFLHVGLAGFLPKTLNISKDQFLHIDVFKHKMNLSGVIAS